MFKTDTETNFHSVADYLARIDSEVIEIRKDQKKKDERLENVEAESKSLRRLVEAKA